MMLRLAHVDGRYEEALESYMKLLEESIDPEIADSSRFFLALLRVSRVAEAIRGFDRALSDSVDTAWRASILYYRAEAKEAMGDLTGAIADLRTSHIPRAHLRPKQIAGKFDE